MTTCVSCGCTEDQPCLDLEHGDRGCHWLIKLDDELGICSECPEAFGAQQAGRLGEYLAQHVPQPSELIVPGDSEFDIRYAR